MIRSLSNRVADLLINIGGDSKMREVYAYGCEGILSTGLILALLITAGFILGKPLQMLVFILAWLPLRMIVGGAHANSHWACTLVSVGLGTVSVRLSDHINKTPAAVMIVLSLCCYAVFFFTAPVVHKNHPISERRYKKARMIARIYAAVLIAIVIALALIGTEITASVFMGVFTTSVLSLLGWFSKNTIRSFCK